MGMKSNMLIKLCNEALLRQCRFSTGHFLKRLFSDDTIDKNEAEDLYHLKRESLVQKKARLQWQSRKRGIAENCLIFGTFSEKYLHQFNDDQVKEYDRIINEPSNEWDLYYWMVGTKPTPEEYSSEIMDMLKEHCRNEKKEERFQQPPLNYKPVKS